MEFLRTKYKNNFKSNRKMERLGLTIESTVVKTANK